MPSFRKNVFQTLLTNTTVLVLGILMSIIVSRILGTELKGYYITSLSFIKLLSFIGNFGVTDATCYFIAKKKFPIKTVLGNTIIISLFSSFVVLFIALITISFFYTKFFPGIPKSAVLLPLISIPFILLGNYLRNILLGSNKIRFYNAVTFIRQISELVLVFVLVFCIGFGLRGALYSFVAASIFTTAVLCLNFFARNKPKISDLSKNYLKQIIKYGYKAHISSFFSYVNISFDILLVNYFLGPAKTGIYSIASTAMQQLILVPTTINYLMVPRIASGGGKNQNGVIKKSILFMLIFYLVSFIVIFFFGKQLISLLFGQSFAYAYYPLRILLVGLIPMGAWMILSGKISGLGKPGYNAFSSTIAAATNIAANIILIPKFGLLGAAYASVISYSLILIISILQLEIINGQKIKKQPIKILQVINSLKIGGAENIVKTLALGSRHQMVFLILADKLNNQYEKELNAKKIKIYSLGSGKFFSFKTQLKILKIIKMVNPTIIHSHLDGLAYIFFPAKLLGKKIIHTIHSEHENLKDIRKKTIYFLAYHSGVVPVGVSERIRKQTDKIFKLKTAICINNGVNIRKLTKKFNQHEIRRRYNLPDNKNIMLNISNLKPVKNQLQLIKNFSKLLKVKKNLFLLIIGEGELKSKLLNSARSLKLNQDNFRIISNCSDPALLLKSSDYFILASKSEGLPLVILEAMAAKLPIISTPSGGVKEIIVHKKNGFIVKNTNSKEILEAINFYSEKKIKVKVIQTAYKDFQKKFKDKKMIKSYDNLYSGH